MDKKSILELGVGTGVLGERGFFLIWEKILYFNCMENIIKLTQHDIIRLTKCS